jgi:protocatechuate 3,4-dioxygenase beta subunit
MRPQIAFQQITAAVSITLAFGGGVAALAQEPAPRPAPPRTQAPPAPGAQRPGVQTGGERQTQPRSRGAVPPRDTVQRTGTARIRGTVSAADTGTPLRRAVVRLSAREMGEGRTALTDAQGVYEFTELPAGRYTLYVSKGGFVALQYGQRRPFEGGQPLEVGEGQRLSGVNVVLPRGSVITGRIGDEFGEPVADAFVSVMRYQYIRGRRRLLPAGRSSQTNDLGQYRIYGLAPGEYYVSVSVRNMEFGPETVGEVTGFAPTYFPGVANPAEAQRVTVALGQEAVADVTLVPSRLVKVSGTIVDSSGKPLPNGFIRLTTPGEFFPMNGAGGRIRENGAFTISGVPPGSYTLVASTRGGGPMRQGPPGSDDATEAATLPITVGNEDMDGVLVTTSKGGRAMGQVIIEGGLANVLPTAVRISTYPVDDDPAGLGFGGPGAGPSEVKADWTFELRSMFGRVGVGVSGAGNLQLKGVYLDGRDVTDTGIEVKPQQVIRGLEVVLTDKRSELSGVVTDWSGQPLRDFTVVVFPEDDAKWTSVSGARYIRTARPDQGGRYQIAGLPPGEYLAIAVDYLDQESGGAQNPELLVRLRDAATSVRLGEGEKKALDLRLVEQ